MHPVVPHAPLPIETVPTNLPTFARSPRTCCGLMERTPSCAASAASSRGAWRRQRSACLCVRCRPQSRSAMRQRRACWSGRHPIARGAHARAAGLLTYRACAGRSWQDTRHVVHAVHAPLGIRQVPGMRSYGAPTCLEPVRTHERQAAAPMHGNGRASHPACQLSCTATAVCVQSLWPPSLQASAQVLVAPRLLVLCAAHSATYVSVWVALPTCMLHCAGRGDSARCAWHLACQARW